MVEVQCTYQDFMRGLHKITDWVNQEHSDLKYVYGIPRGGLLLAVALSHRTKLKFTMSDPLRNYEDPDTTEQVLIVDDISDTGETLIDYRKAGFKIATLHYREGSEVIPDKYIYVKKDGDWIKYFWE